MSNKHVRHVGKKEKARRLAQIKKRAAAARKKAPKKRPVVQEPEPQEAPSEFDKHTESLEWKYLPSEPVEVAPLMASDSEQAIVNAIEEKLTDGSK